MRECMWLRLDYRRREDDTHAYLLASLVPGRNVKLCGNPEQLRIPGLSPTEEIGIIEWPDGQFHVRPLGDAELLYQGKSIGMAGLAIGPNCSFTIDEYEFSIQASLPEEVADDELVPTPTRWRMSSASIFQDNGDWCEPQSSAEQAFADELRPLKAVKNHIAALQLVESELQRLNRVDELDLEDRHVISLWTMRLRFGSILNVDHLADIASQATALFPNCSVIQTAAGIAYLSRGNFDEAESCFARAQHGGEKGIVEIRNRARVGKAVARSFAVRAANGPRSLRTMLMQWLEKRTDLVIRVDVPSDWHMALSYVISSELCGPSASTEVVLRWRESYDGNLPSERMYFEIRDRETKEWLECLIIEHPTTLYCDPTLEMEVFLFQRELAQQVDAGITVRDGERTRWDSALIRLDESSLCSVHWCNQGRMPMRLTASEPRSDNGSLALTVVDAPLAEDVVWTTALGEFSTPPQLAMEVWGAVLIGNGTHTALALPSGELIPVRCVRQSTVEGPAYGYSPPVQTFESNARPAVKPFTYHGRIRSARMWRLIDYCKETLCPLVTISFFGLYVVWCLYYSLVLKQVIVGSICRAFQIQSIPVPFILHLIVMIGIPMLPVFAVCLLMDKLHGKSSFVTHNRDYWNKKRDGDSNERPVKPDL